MERKNFSFLFAWFKLVVPDNFLLKLECVILFSIEAGFNSPLVDENCMNPGVWLLSVCPALGGFENDNIIGDSSASSLQ